jgi:hypothetical protein
MNNSRTPKIVVGAGLGVVYAIGLTMIMMRDEPDSSVAQPATVETAAQMASEPASSSAIISEPVDMSTSVIEQPVSRTDAAAPTVDATARRVEPAAAKEQGIGSGATSARPEAIDIPKPDPTGEVAKVGSETSSSSGEVPSSEEVGSEPSEGEPSVGSADVMTEDGEVD